MSGITLSTRPKQPVIFNSDRFTGLSAYEVAVANGFDGTVEEWLLSLEGPQGPQGEVGLTGPQGEQGIPGEQGPQGTPGEDGASAYEVAVAAGFNGTVEEWLLSLVGPQGEPGEVPDLASYLTKSEASSTYATILQLGNIDDILDILNGDLEEDIQAILDNMEGV